MILQLVVYNSADVLRKADLHSSSENSRRPVSSNARIGLNESGEVNRLHSRKLQAYLGSPPSPQCLASGGI